jgi:hypothetical protein
MRVYSSADGIHEVSLYRARSMANMVCCPNGIESYRITHAIQSPAKIVSRLRPEPNPSGQRRKRGLWCEDSTFVSCCRAASYTSWLTSIAEICKSFGTCAFFPGKTNTMQWECQDPGRWNEELSRALPTSQGYRIQLGCVHHILRRHCWSTACQYRLEEILSQAVPTSHHDSLGSSCAGNCRRKQRHWSARRSFLLGYPRSCCGTFVYHVLLHVVQTL